MIAKKTTPFNPSQPPLVRGGAMTLVPFLDEVDQGGCRPSPDKGRLGGVRGNLKRAGFIPYNKKLTAFARENRKNPTAAETKMWNGVLRMRHFADYKFLRQKPISDFIADFYCAALHLVIEIDGDTHAEAAAYDMKRTAALGALGITVIRYTNDDILNNLSGVYDDLSIKVASLNDGLAKS